MAIRQRLKRKVKTVLKSFIDRLVDADSEPFQESQPSSSVDYDVKKQSSDASNIDKSQVEVATVENPVVEEEARVEAVDAPASESESIAEAPKAEAQTVEQPVEQLVEQSEEEKKEAAVAKHWEKTRRGLLKKIQKEGGSIGLAALHDFSERRYFIGHQKFSMIMEELVEEELVLYSLEDYLVTLGEQAVENLCRY